MSNLESENNVEGKVDAYPGDVTKNGSGNVDLNNLNIGVGNNLINLLKRMNSRSKTIATGMQALDDFLNGGLRPGVTVIAGKPGEGKTTFTLFLLEQFSQLGIQTVYFCNDMPVEDVVAKGLSRNSFLIAQEKGFTATEILKHYENGLKDNPTFMATCETYKNNTLNLRIVDISGSLEFDNICKVIADYIGAERRQPVIVIDYLQKIVVQNTTSDKEKVDFIIEQLKAFAITYNLPILVLSSINRMSYRRELSMDSLKESGGLEFNSDVVIGIQQKGIGDANFNIEKAKSKDIWEMELVILKQRLGSADVKIPVQFYPKYNMFPYYNPAMEKKKIKKASDYIKL